MEVAQVVYCIHHRNLEEVLQVCDTRFLDALNTFSSDQTLKWSKRSLFILSFVSTLLNPLLPLEVKD